MSSSRNSSREQYTLEFIPDEIFIQIFKNLQQQDISRCRVVSSIMREQIDRLSNSQFCVILSDKNEDEFTKKTSLHPNFRRMQVLHLKSTTICTQLRKEYFRAVTDLQFTEAISKTNFSQIIKLTQHLRILRLSSAVLGGTRDLFGSLLKSSMFTGKLKKSSILFTVVPVNLIKFMFGGTVRRKLENLQEIYVKLDYISPSAANFSPHILVENLRSLHYLKVANLLLFSITVEKSKDSEMFFFTIDFLVNTIPIMSYQSLQAVSIKSPKFRPSQGIRKGNWSSKCKLDTLKLTEFDFQVTDGYNHDTPPNLRHLLLGQVSLKKLTIIGVRDPYLPDVVDQVVENNKSTLKTLHLI